jgi:hypothetical protein
MVLFSSLDSNWDTYLQDKPQLHQKSNLKFATELAIIWKNEYFDENFGI